MNKVMAPIFLMLAFVVGCSSSASTEEKISYENDLREVVALMISQSAKAEETVKIYSNVWSTSLDTDIGVDHMAIILGIEPRDVRLNFKRDASGRHIAFEGDFNTALSKTHKYLEKEGKNEEIESKRDEIKVLIRKLNNPPEEYKGAYDIAFEIYSLYESYITLALSPSGSLLSYNQEANELSTNIVTKVKEFEVKMPMNE